MTHSNRWGPSGTTIAVAISLSVGLAATAIAADPSAKLSKAKVRAIANAEIDKRAPGLSVAHAATAAKADTAATAASATSATTATSAVSADNADKLDGFDSAAFVRSDICQPRTIVAFARFNPALMPAFPTYSTAGITFPANCEGGTVEASRLGLGSYRIRFNGVGATFTVCTSVQDGEPVAPRAISVGVISGGHLSVRQVDPSAGGIDADGKFVCVVV
jgi:hypothetical protein